MDLGIKGKRALVMGASQGLGFAVAKALASEGARVAICSRDQTRIEKAGQEIGAELSLAFDLSKPGAGRDLIRQVTQKLGGVDILVTNTGGPPKGFFSDTKAEQWQAGFQSLWMSVVDSIQEVLPAMREQRWGRILLVTSMAAKEPETGLTISNGLRAGLLGLMKTISTEVAPHGVTVNSVLPGFTDTERLRELGMTEDKVKHKIPAARLGRPEEFAAAVAFLASAQAGYITGQALVCDGGYNRGV